MLVGHDLAEAFHFGAAVLDDVGNAVVVGGEPAEGEVWALEDSFHAGSLFAAGGVRLVAAVAVVVVELAAGGLLRVESEFSVGFAALDVTGGSGEDRCGETEA